MTFEEATGELFLHFNDTLHSATAPLGEGVAALFAAAGLRRRWAEDVEA